MSRTLSRTERIYLALWRQAYLRSLEPSPEPLFINCSTQSMMMTQRLGLYRAIRPYRNGTDFDEELRLAADSLVLTMSEIPNNPEFSCRITFTPRKALGELELQMADLGLSEDDLLLTEEKTATLALKAMIEPDGDKGSANPFYNRG